MKWGCAKYGAGLGLGFTGSPRATSVKVRVFGPRRRCRLTGGWTSQAASAYPLRTAHKGTFGWGAKIARTWLHKETILARNNYFTESGWYQHFSNL